MQALRTAATGMAAQQLNVEVISNNIANMNTVAFKRQRAEFQDLLYQTLEQAGAQSSDQGTIVPTGVQVGAGVKAGDILDVELELDTEKREVDVPADLAAAIDAAPEARRYFDTLSYSKKLALVNKMNVKNPDVRQERIDSTVAQLLTGKV